MMSDAIKKFIDAFEQSIQTRPLVSDASNTVRTGCLLFDIGKMESEAAEDTLAFYTDLMPHVFELFGICASAKPELEIARVCKEIEKILNGRSDLTGFLHIHDPQLRLENQHALLDMLFVSVEPGDLSIALRALIRKPGSDTFDVAKAIELINIAGPSFRAA